MLSKPVPHVKITESNNQGVRSEEKKIRFVCTRLSREERECEGKKPVYRITWSLNKVKLDFRTEKKERMVKRI